LLVGIAEEHHKREVFLPDFVFLTPPLCSQNSESVSLACLVPPCSHLVLVSFSSQSRLGHSLVSVSISSRSWPCLSRSLISVSVGLVSVLASSRSWPLLGLNLISVLVVSRSWSHLDLTPSSTHPDSHCHMWVVSMLSQVINR
jgi:hypothetical protein